MQLQSLIVLATELLFKILSDRADLYQLSSALNSEIWWKILGFKATILITRDTVNEWCIDSLDPRHYHEDSPFVINPGDEASVNSVHEKLMEYTYTVNANMLVFCQLGMSHK